MSEYRPGVCNIGQGERRARRAAGVLGLVAGAAVVAAVAVAALPRVAYLGAFPFLLFGYLGVLQDRLRFCVGFGALARYDLSASGGDAKRVTDAEAVRRDRRRAVRIVAYATALAGLTTGLVYLVAGL